MKIAITGATGFVGAKVLRKLVELGHLPMVVLRSTSEKFNNFENILVSSIDSKTNWKDSLNGCDVVIHCAARVHVMTEKSYDPLAEFREVNTLGTLNLARAAAKEGVRRFIFISTIKVSGEKTDLGTPFKSSDKPNPSDPYGISKYEAEQGLKELAIKTGMEVVIIRPPLVYGPGVKGNFASMLKLTSIGLPLPFGTINNNLRSLVSIDNLVDLIATCISKPIAANRVFLVSDDEDISTASMFKCLSKSFGKSGLMIPIPVFLFEMIGKLAGKSDVINRLCGNLQVDIADTKSLLDWKPVTNLEDGFAKTAEHFLRNK